MNTRVKLGLIFILVIFALALILSQNANPDFPPFFGLKRIQEKVFLSLEADPSGIIDYQMALLNKRLNELKSLVNNKSYSYLLTASQRYSTTAGQITELMINNNLGNKVDSIKKQFLEHQKVLNDLYIAYPKNTDNVEYKYLEDAINYLKIYLEKLSSIK